MLEALPVFLLARALQREFSAKTSTAEVRRCVSVKECRRCLKSLQRKLWKSFVLFPVDGAWTPWSVWSDCSATCGRGTHVRTRACINPPPRNNGSHCSGPEKETQECQTPPCLGLYLKTRKEKPHILSNQREFHLLLYQQMTFALGLLGHRAPRRAGRGLYHDTGRVCASREEMRRVPLRSRLRGTAWRRSCATNSPVQVQESSWQHWSQTNSHDRCLCCFSLNSWRLCVSSAFLRSHCN